MPKLSREDLVLAAFSAAPDDAVFTPVQVQKLFFLIDERISDRVGGPHFKFRAYDYGPFDPEVYRALEALAEKEFVQIGSPASFSAKSYRLTSQGRALGSSILNQLDQGTRSFLADLVGWVRGRSFRELVTAIYAEFPAMEGRSVFRG